MSENTQSPAGNVVEFASRPPQPPSPRFNGLMDFLQDWRSADHADAIQLSRAQVIDLIEGVEALREMLLHRRA